MKSYIISRNGKEYYNAASKARNDIETVACEKGFERLLFQGQITGEGNILKWFQLLRETFRNWNHLMTNTKTGSMILLQYPMLPVKSAYLIRFLLPLSQKRKKLKFTAFIHDIDALRGFHGKMGKYWGEKILPLFDLIVCHNEPMKKYLTENGIPEEKIIVLGIFDYLTNESCQSHNKNDGITIAGNLSPEKSGYISRLIEAEHGKISIHLYGKGLENVPPEVVYHGVFPPEILPSCLCGAYGLVWDGNSTETCAGPTGEYLRYNNPHKISLYLAAGMPVIIWKQAALATFVEEKGVGFTIESLDEIKRKIDSISDQQYNEMKKNAQRIGERLREGYYSRAAIEKAIEITQGRN